MADGVNTVASVLAACRTFGDLPAVWDDEVRWTFTDLEREVLRAVRAFISLGVEPGDRVALRSTNSARWIVAALGLQGAGGVLVPLNTRFKGEEIAYVLDRSGASVLVTEDLPHVMSMMRSTSSRTVTRSLVDLSSEWTQFLDRGRQTPESAVRERIGSIGSDDLSDILFTSGTTGYPKGVRITHGQSVRAYGDLGDGFGYRPGDRYLLIPPFFHALGYKSGWFAGLLKGCLVLPERSFDSRRMIDRIQRDRVTMMIGPPTVFAELLDGPHLAEADIGSLRLVIPSATNVPPELVRRMREDLHLEVLTGYGLTESSAIATYSRNGDDPDVIADSAGRPAPGVDIRIADDADRPLPTGSQGNILVGGYVVTTGYWEDPEATAQVLTADGHLRTGDVGYVDGHGCVHVTGRKKDLIIVGGFNVYPAEVERLLSRYPGVAEVAVVGVPDARLGEVPFAFVVNSAGTTMDEQSFLDWSRAHMANFKAPRHVTVVDELPKNPSMKVLRSELRVRGAAQIAGRE